MNILFWNLRGNPIAEYVRQCLIENRVDIAVFAEHRGVDFQALERETDGFRYECGIGGPRKIILFASGASVQVAAHDDRYLICRVEYAGNRYILAGVHLQDRWTRPESESAARMVIIRSLVKDVEALEASYKCDRTIIIGDLNANPYDKELLNADAFNAPHSRWNTIPALL